MKPQTLPTKRRPVSKGLFRRLSAVTGNRRQRVAATATPDMEMDDGSSKISRALTIIFLIHIVAIGLIFMHQKFLSGRSASETTATAPAKENAIQSNQQLNLPRIDPNEQPYVVKQGDNYARIAVALGVDEGDLRLANKHADIVPGRLLKVPAKRAVAVIEETPVTVKPLLAAQEPAMLDIVDTSEDELVDTAPPAVSDIPRAKIVDDKATSQPKPKASGKSYVVKSGDSIWKIANKYKVNESALLKANGIKDARKIKVGTSLIIPQ
ncbi:MAG: LysM peptidoglycan-binding domain-containing protein [Akkermansiaceae bacterium]|nr:LysM peptidoglycan-binding domain-containing protein [Akkermansiaceae bacterium]